MYAMESRSLLKDSGVDEGRVDEGRINECEVDRGCSRGRVLD